MTTPRSFTASSVSSAVNGWNADYISQQYDQFKADPDSIPADMQAFFQGFDLALTAGVTVAPVAGVSAVQKSVDDLVHAYRDVGHLAASTDPLGRVPQRPSQLDPTAHGLNAADMSRVVNTTVIPGRASASIAEIIAHMQRAYCGSIGFEFTHIHDAEERAWFLSCVEMGQHLPSLSDADKAQILDELTGAESLDKFLGKRYQGKKRFSLEGGEALIPCLKWLTRRAGELGTQEIILGMAHRGRVSVLKNYMGKDLIKLFTEFEDSWHDKVFETGGDVKYHRGYSGDQPLPDGGNVHLSLLNNPSHLESVNAIVMGRCRAKQDREGDTERRKHISLLIHGDAALPGQGVVAECLNMSQLAGYNVGGSIHVVINNLVGFTTDPSDSRSTHYCTDIAKMVNAPVLHVNGGDPEAVVIASWLAAEYRHTFRRDIFVDLICFRRYGHNEQDEPAYTQPALYSLIKEHPGTPEVYRRKLVASGVVSAEVAQAMIDREMTELDRAQTASRGEPVNPVQPPGKGSWNGIQGQYCFESPKTAVSKSVIAEVCKAMGTAPEGFNVHPKLNALLEARASLPKTNKLSHADAEQIAIGTLVLDGYAVRLSGQDSRRGTFSQRHAVLRDEKTSERFTPLNHIRTGQPAQFDPLDSPLSEFSVMGFEYGYSRGAPKTLVMWEGQFGDFVNSAQVLIDQYLVSSESKWSRWAGLVLLLPHGYEGQGPEHSSGRLERFLQLCAEENIEVAYPSTGAQTFHLLRRQMLRDFRKPLVVMTPKKFLRVETSTVDELSTGAFQHLIDDTAFASPAAAKSVTRVIYCSGKIFHELNDRRQATGKQGVAIVRVEQLFPLHAEMLKKIDARYPATAQRIWVQEEPRNMGAFQYAADAFVEAAGIKLGYIGRVPSASPATASEYSHKKQQDRVLSDAIAPLPAAKAAGKPEDHGAGSNGTEINKSATLSTPSTKSSGKPGIKSASKAVGKSDMKPRSGATGAGTKTKR